MEGSINTSVVALSDEEESGWTAYFQDLSDHHHHHHSLSSRFCTSSSSMVSDAASFPAWKSFNNNKHDSVASPSIGASPNNIPNKLTFKKTRAKEISHHDSLEDTASSPVSSPKVSDIDINSRKTNDHFNSSLGKGNSLEDYEGVAVETQERSEKNCSGNKDCTDLKKRGLCLLPLSMLVNYLG